MSKRNALTIAIFAGLLIGVLIGQFVLYDPGLDPEAQAAAVQGWYNAGDLIFIRPLRMLIIPLIFTSVMTGIMSIGDPKKLGLLGGATVFFYVTTMVAAVGLGVTMAAVAQPGASMATNEEALASVADSAGALANVPVADSATEGIASAWLNILYQMVPNNFLEAAVEVQALSVITATILLAIGVVAVGEKAKPIRVFVESLHEVLMTIVQWIIWLMPLGVLFLVAWAVGRIGIQTLFGGLARYVIVVLLGLLIHMMLTLPTVLWLLTRMNPFKFMWDMKPALLTAFGTSSSMATLPVTIETCHESGCSKRATGLVLPLGATVNMDGTALYQGITVIFLFQAFGIELEFVQYLAVVLTATLAAIGTAAVPGASIVTMIIIISAVNQTMMGMDGFEPLQIAAIGLILPVDRFLDMCRTTVNVWGDSVGARVITRLAPDEAEEREAAFA